MKPLTIMVSTDGSNLSEKAIDTAVDLAKQLDAQLIGATVCTVVGGDGQPEAKYQAALDVIAQKAKAADVPVQTKVLLAAGVAEGLLKAMKEYDVAYFVMASRGLGTIGSLILGSETQKVLHGADRPVLVVR